MTKEKFATLWAYITNQEEVIEVVFVKIEQLKPLNEDKMVHLAYQLHNLYSLYEDIFKEIAETFENNIDKSSNYHKNLLIRMKLSIPNIRPSVLSNENYLIINELLSFRHVFRHAYNYTLSPDKMEILRDKILNSKESLKNDFKIFKAFLESKYN